jgi:hypothetical protein
MRIRVSRGASVSRTLPPRWELTAYRPHQTTILNRLGLWPRVRPSTAPVLVATELVDVSLTPTRALPVLAPVEKRWARTSGSTQTVVTPLLVMTMVEVLQVLAARLVLFASRLVRRASRTRGGWTCMALAQPPKMTRVLVLLMAWPLEPVLVFNLRHPSK